MIIRAAFPLRIGSIRMHDRRSVFVNESVEYRISQTIRDNDARVGAPRNDSDYRNTCIGVIQLEASDETLYAVLIERAHTAQLYADVLFYNKATGRFADSSVYLNLHAMYRFEGDRFERSNLMDLFNIRTPEISLEDFDRDGKADFRFTRLWHVGTANEIETKLVSAGPAGIRTLSLYRSPIPSKNVGARRSN